MKKKLCFSVFIPFLWIILLNSCSRSNGTSEVPIEEKNHSYSSPFINSNLEIPEITNSPKTSLESIRKDNSVETVRKFYAALSPSTKDCDTAIEISPSYSRQSCMNIGQADIIDLSILMQAVNSVAIVYLKLAYAKKDSEAETFTGYVQLVKNQHCLWEINKYSSESEQVVLDTLFTPYENNIPQACSTKEKATLHIQENILDSVFKLIESSPQPIANNKIFGSPKILNACWTQEELKGLETDKKVIRPFNNPDRSPPLRQIPIHKRDALKPDYQNSIRSVKPRNNRKIVALTFDLCERTLERTGYDAEIINYLRQHNIKATFYAGGKWMRSHPEKTKQLMADPLFEIGNHAWTHGNMRVLEAQDLQEMHNQILWTQAQYELLYEELSGRFNNCRLSSLSKNEWLTEINNIPAIPLTFRFPYGTCGPNSLNALADYGLPAIQWDIVTADPWKGQTAEGIANAIKKRIKPGSIIIAHANGRGHKTSEALKLFIQPILDKEYEFVTVTELLNEAEIIYTEETCYEERPGDNKRYDKIFGRGTE